MVYPCGEMKYTFNQHTVKREQEPKAYHGELEPKQETILSSLTFSNHDLPRI